MTVLLFYNLHKRPPQSFDTSASSLPSVINIIIASQPHKSRRQGIPHQFEGFCPLRYIRPICPSTKPFLCLLTMGSHRSVPPWSTPWGNLSRFSNISNTYNSSNN